MRRNRRRLRAHRSRWRRPRPAGRPGRQQKSGQEHAWERRKVTRGRARASGAELRRETNARDANRPLPQQSRELLGCDPGCFQDGSQGAPIQLIVHRNCQRRAAGALQTNMAASLADLHIPEARQGSDALSRRDQGWCRHSRSSRHGDVDQLSPGLVTRFEAQRDGFTNVGERLVTSLALRDAPRQDGALGDDPAVIAGPKNHGQCAHDHHASTAKRARHTRPTAPRTGRRRSRIGGRRGAGGGRSIACPATAGSRREGARKPKATHEMLIADLVGVAGAAPALVAGLARADAAIAAGAPARADLAALGTGPALKAATFGGSGPRGEAGGDERDREGEGGGGDGPSDAAGHLGTSFRARAARQIFHPTAGAGPHARGLVLLDRARARSMIGALLRP